MFSAIADHVDGLSFLLGVVVMIWSARTVYSYGYYHGADAVMAEMQERQS